MNIEYSLVDSNVISGSTREKDSMILRESTLRKSAKNNRMMGRGSKMDNSSRDWRKPQHAGSEEQDVGGTFSKQASRGKEQQQQAEDDDPSRNNNIGYTRLDAHDPSTSAGQGSQHHGHPQGGFEPPSSTNLSNAHTSQHVHNDAHPHRKPGVNNNSTATGNLDNRHLSTFSDFRAGNILDFSTSHHSSGSSSFPHGGGTSAKSRQGKLRDPSSCVGHGDDVTDNLDFNDSGSAIADGAAYHFHNQQQQHDGMFLLPSESRFLKSKSGAHLSPDNSRSARLNNAGGGGSSTSLSPPKHEEGTSSTSTGPGLSGDGHSSSHYELDSGGGQQPHEEKRSRNANNTNTYLVSVDAHHGVADHGSASTSKISGGGRKVGADRRKKNNFV